MNTEQEKKADADAYLVEVDGDTVIPTELCGGPWSPDAQHGSAVAATLAWAVEQVQTPVPMRPVRITIDLLSPVPLTPMRWEATTVKAGKRIAVIDSALYDGDRVAARATALLMRSGATIDVPVDANVPSAPPLPSREPVAEEVFASGGPDSFPMGFMQAMDCNRTAGAMGGGAPASMWMRLRCRTVAGEDATPFQWLLAAADMGSQLGGYLPYDRFRTINADLSVPTSPGCQRAPGSGSMASIEWRRTRLARRQPTCSTRPVFSGRCSRRCTSIDGRGSRYG